MGTMKNNLEIEHARASGFKSTSEESGVSYAVFPDTVIQRLFADGVDHDGENVGFGCIEDVPVYLTGWYEYYHGAGRGFAHTPNVRHVGKGWIVTCFSGSDI